MIYKILLIQYSRARQVSGGRIGRVNVCFARVQGPAGRSGGAMGQFGGVSRADRAGLAGRAKQGIERFERRCCDP